LGIMDRFDEDDPHYHSCCCGCHVTTLSRVLIIIALVCYAIHLLRFLSPLGIAGLIITIIGVIAVFQELKVTITIYIVLVIFHFIVSVIYGLYAVTTDPEYKRNFDPNVAVPAVLLIYFVEAIVEIPFLITYGNLAQFIEDRDCAEEDLGMAQVRVNKPTRAAPATHYAPVASAAPSQAPPPYDVIDMV
ncbi:hypothetical protein PENTCL1PPCAC_22108, partial [Pristionchus entomophagus]